MKITVTPVPLRPSMVEYAAGVPVVEIAARYGVTPKTIRKRARLLGLPPRKVKLAGQRLKRTLMLYRRGWEWRRICATIGIDSTTLADALHRNGVRMRLERARTA